MTEGLIIGVEDRPTLGLLDIPTYSADQIPDDSSFEGMVYDDLSRQNHDIHKLSDGTIIKTVSEMSAPIEIRI